MNKPKGKIKIGFNGRIVRADQQTFCDACESPVASGIKLASIAHVDKWIYICKACLKSFYAGVHGFH